MSKQLSCRWIETKLGEICEKITDGAHLSPNSVDDGFPMASVKDLNSFGINIETCRKISQTDYKKLVRQGCQPQKDDVLIAKDGATALDTVSLVKKPLDVVLLSSVAILRPNKDKIVPLYLRYYLESIETRAYMKNAFISGAAIPRVILKDFKQAKINMPPVLIQSKIVSILSAYDDLIENNLRRIKILEEMAQNLYREWFVNFRFPGHGQTHFGDSPLGQIPEGWEVVPMKTVANVVDCLHSKKPDIDDDGSGILIQLFNIGNGGKFDFSKKYLISEDDYVKWTKRIELSEGDCIITNVGRIAAVAQMPKGKKAALGRNMTGLRPIKGKITPTYLIEYLLSPHMASEVRKKSDSGVIMDSLNVRSIYLLSVPIPDGRLMDDFEYIARPIRQNIENLVEKNYFLRQTRDLLLPRLISGEVDISELDINVSEEAV